MAVVFGARCGCHGVAGRNDADLSEKVDGEPARTKLGKRREQQVKVVAG